jgi:hypothetical protein
MPSRIAIIVANACAQRNAPLCAGFAAARGLDANSEGA